MKVVLESSLMKRFSPFFKFLDGGLLFKEPFRWLYLLFALGCAFAPFYLLYKVYDLFSYMNAKEIIATVLIVLVLTAALGISVLYWVRSSSKVGELTSEHDDFVAIPVYAHLIKSVGEWGGLFVGAAGFLVSLIAFLFFGEEFSGLSRMLSDGFLPLGGGAIGFFYPLVMGFMIVLSSRALSELILALASIANNTKK